MRQHNSKGAADNPQRDQQRCVMPRHQKPPREQNDKQQQASRKSVQTSLPKQSQLSAMVTSLQCESPDEVIKYAGFYG